MNVNYIQNYNKLEGLILLPFMETENEILFEEIKISKKIFSGKKDTSYLVEKEGKIFLFIGLGNKLEYKNVKIVFRRVASKHIDLFFDNVTLIFSEEFSNDLVEAAISGLILGGYKLGHFKKEQETHPIFKENFQWNVYSKSHIKEHVERGVKIANAQAETFKLVDLPPNIINPKYLAEWSIKAGEKYGFSTTVFGKEESNNIGLHSFLSVGRGSANEPQFIILDYNPKNSKKHIGLVGKGITFDTGGLNIKTAGMVHMKCDMAGGGAVLGAMQLISDLQLPYRVTAIVPACENSVDSQSFMPSDVIKSYSGHTIEIIDTDAEGRLILIDGLSYLIKNYNPEIVIDIATLTGSSVGTFGYECGALFTNDNILSKKLQETGMKIGEKLWQLPLWSEYETDIQSEIADVKNFSGKPVAGAISAAKFLEYFTDKHPSWAHLDIAGVSFVDDEFAKTKHATAFGVHLITNFIENL